MGTEIEIHPIQAKILRELLFKTEARFSELNKTELTNDHFTFHINQLIDLNLIEKNKNNQYQLTPKGKEFANRMDTDKVSIEKQAKVSVCIVCTRKNKGIQEFLIQRRLKHPYYNFHGLVTGKIHWGETVLETARRELKEETGLTGKLRFVGIEHKMDYSADGKMLEDKFFFIFKGEEMKGTFIENFEGGKNIWYSENEVKKLPLLFKDVIQIIEVVKKASTKFFENKFIESIY